MRGGALRAKRRRSAPHPAEPELPWRDQSIAHSGVRQALLPPAGINQADILTPIAPIIQARSDTFVVRGYGEARSPDGTRILARAWCEAVVQRVPDYLDAAADPTETPYANLQSPVNRRFGRRIRITSFRWLPGGAM